MFRRLESSLPEDPVFPANLEKLGYFINEYDQPRLLSDHNQEFKYNISKNDRVKVVNREAFNECLRQTIMSRLLELGLEEIRLPLGASTIDKHVPILVSKGLLQRSRVIVFFGEPCQDLGVFAYRLTAQRGINVGSAVNFVKAVQSGMASSRGEESPGIILANTGQLIWHCGGSKAMTITSWGALTRKTAVHPGMAYDETRNAIPGNENWREHVSYVFNNVLDKLVSPGAKIDIIGLENGGLAALEYLARNWPRWSTRISGICLGEPQHQKYELSPEGASTDFADFISRRCRAYLVWDAELDTPVHEIMKRRKGLLISEDETLVPVTGRELYGCNCYASGEKQFSESVVVEAYESMLAWFKMVHAVQGFAEVEMAPPSLEQNDGETLEIVRSGMEIPFAQ